jgi:hypothetical protein
MSSTDLYMLLVSKSGKQKEHIVPPHRAQHDVQGLHARIRPYYVLEKGKGTARGTRTSCSRFTYSTASGFDRVDAAIADGNAETSTCK